MALVMGRLLGEGAFGKVYFATDDVHGEVAVKVFTQGPKEIGSAWESRKKKLLKEAQSLAKAKHRNVVQVYYLDEAPAGTVRLVMEYCQGGSVGDLYEAGPIKIDRVHKIVTDVTHGLEALHSKPMLHRDIKPANILLDSQGNARLADFGLVTDDLMLGYASAKGYNDHLAYEIHARGEGTSTRTDIWALGMTTYRLLHGDTWYKESPVPRYLIADGGFAVNLPWLPHVPDCWRRLIRKAMHDDSKSRHKSAVDFCNALASVNTTATWTCSFSPALMKWEKIEGKRRIHVAAERHGSGTYEWRAWSEDFRGKTPRTLAGSANVTKSQCFQELRAFFKKRE